MLAVPVVAEGAGGGRTAGGDICGGETAGEKDCGEYAGGAATCGALCGVCEAGAGGGGMCDGTTSCAIIYVDEVMWKLRVGQAS